MLTHKSRHLAWAVAALVAVSASSAQDAPANKLSVSGHGKTAFMGSERGRDGAYNGPYNFSPAVRAGDYVFVSGVVAGAFGEESPINKETFKNSIRRAFSSLSTVLNAAGADMNQIVKLRTFHVFDSPLINVSKRDQVLAVAEVKAEFIEEPHPAWTAVGSTALLPDAGLVEIEVIAYAPQK